MMVRRSIAAIALVTVLAATAAAAPSSINYSGRLTATNGKPVTGPIDLEVKFFDSSTGGTQRGSTIDFDDVVLSQGIFQIAIALSPTDENAVFGAATASWIQIKDKTNNRTLPRQQFSAVPYALRVGPAAPGFDAFLKIDTDGTLSWEAGGGTTVVPDAVATSSIQDDAVTTAKVLDGTIVDADIADLNAAKLTGTVDPARFSAYADLTAETKIGTGAAQVAAGDHNHAGVYAPTSHSHGNADITALDGGKISTGTISTDRYSAYADLGAESKIGTGAAQVAAGNHAHTATDIGLGNVQNVNMLNGFSQNDAQWVATDEIRARDGGGLKLFDDGGNGVFVQDGGNVGIGTTNPQAKLHMAAETALDIRGAVATAVAGDRANFKGLRYRGTLASPTIVADNDALVGLTGTGYDGVADIVGARIAIHVDGTPGVNDMPGRISLLTTPDGSATAVERMRIDSAGNVGIGTTSPETKLDVAGGDILVDNNSYYRAEDNAGINAQILGFDTSNNLVINRQTLITGNDYKTIIGGDSIEFRDASNGTDVIIDATGNVGIGTTAPNYKLDVAQTGASAVHFGPSADNGAYLTSTAPGQALISGGTAWNGSAWVAKHTSQSTIEASSGFINFLTDSGLTVGNTYTQTPRMTISTAGNVGIGTTNPTAKLHVGGTAGTDGIRFPDGTLQTTAAGEALIETQNASNSTQIVFNDLDGTFDDYKVVMSNVVPSTDAVYMLMQVSTDNGATWVTTSTYADALHGVYSGGNGTNGSASTTSIQLTVSGANYLLGNGTGESMAGELMIYAPASTTKYKLFAGDFVNWSAVPTPVRVTTSGVYRNTTAINAIKIYMSSGNIASGKFKLYGLK
jgi:hypothetical protein